MENNILLVIVVYIAVFLIVAACVMLLWNALIPALFGLKAITYWQSMLLYGLTSVLFKSPGSITK